MSQAHDLVDARRHRRVVTAPGRRGDVFSLADGYALGAEVARLWSAGGHVRSGVKVGLTYRHKWDALGISAPVWAPVYSDQVTDAGSFSMAPLVSPRVEAEVIVGLASDLGPGASSDEVAAAVGWAALGFEVVDCHYEGWSLTPPDLVADFGVHAGLVIGPARPLTVDELLGLAGLGITLIADGSPVAAGSGAEVVGGPMRAVAALLAAPHAPVLPAGSLVSTGALTGGAHPVSAGQTWRIEPEGGLLTGTAARWDA